MLDSDTVDSYYKDRTALYTVTIPEDKVNDTVPKIRTLIGDDNTMTGSGKSFGKRYCHQLGNRLPLYAGYHSDQRAVRFAGTVVPYQSAQKIITLCPPASRLFR